MSRTYTLVPFHAAEGITLKQAADVAGKSVRTLRNWSTDHGIGRRVANGTWVVSQVALAMLLDGDIDSLICYRDHGVRASYEPVAKYYEPVAKYYERLGLGELLERPEFAV